MYVVGAFYTAVSAPLLSVFFFVSPLPSPLSWFSFLSLSLSFPTSKEEGATFHSD